MQERHERRETERSGPEDREDVTDLNDLSGRKMASAEVQRSVNLPLGQVLITPGAIEALAAEKASPRLFLARHQRGDWGEMDAGDWSANDQALYQEERILSSYVLPETARRLWIITEWDRSATTILLPSEY